MIFQLDEIALLRDFAKISSFGFVEIVLEWITSTKMEMNKYLEVIFGMLAAGRFKNFDSHWLKTGARRNRTMFQNLPLLSPSLTDTHLVSLSLPHWECVGYMEMILLRSVSQRLRYKYEHFSRRLGKSKEEQPHPQISTSNCWILIDLGWVGGRWVTSYPFPEIIYLHPRQHQWNIKVSHRSSFVRRYKQTGKMFGNVYEK